MFNTPDWRIAEAVKMLMDFGAVDGGHHKMWVIDQTLRILLGDEYEQAIKDYEADGEYSWDEGIAP